MINRNVWLSAIMAILSALVVISCGGGGGGGGDSVQIPAAPVGVKAENGNGVVRISWGASSGATSYNIYWSTSSVVTKTTGTRIAGVTSPYDHPSLANGTTYRYVVTAVNGAGESAESSQVSATPAASTPSAPTGLTAAPGNNQVALSWAASTAASTYKVYRGASSGVLGSKTLVSTVTGTNFTDTSVVNGTPYYYQVTAANLNGESGGSSEVASTPALPPAPYIVAGVFSDANSTSADAEVLVRNYNTGAYITNATVMVNNTTLAYDSFSQTYTGTVTVNKGGAVNLSVASGGVTFSESLTMYSVFPAILAPVSGATWDHTKSYTPAWSASSPSPGTYDIDIYKQGALVYYTGSATTSVTIPANSLTAGSHQLYVSVSDATPISGAANQSQFNIYAISAPVSITVQ